MNLKPDTPFNADTLFPKVGDRVVWSGMPGIYELTYWGPRHCGLKDKETGEIYLSVKRELVTKYVQMRAPKEEKEKLSPEQEYASLDEEFNS